MMLTKNIVPLIVLGGILIACSPTQAVDQATPSPDLAKTAEHGTQESAQLEKTQIAQETSDAVHAMETTTAQETLAAIETAGVEATSQAHEKSATMTARFQAREAQATQLAEEQATLAAATADAMIQATAQSEPMVTLVNSLYEKEIISRVKGTFIPLPDYDYSWAQLDWYNWTITGQEPKDFVLVADLSWESASDTANWWNSGCGFAFRINEDGDHYLTYLGLDGYVGLYRNINSKVSAVGRGYVGSVDLPDGTASFLMTADGNSFTFFVDNERIHTRMDSALEEGGLGYVLVSGTNKDFGTWCQWENVRLWILE